MAETVSVIIGRGVQYQVDQTGHVTFYEPPDDSPETRALMDRIEREEALKRPVNRGDVEELLAALSRIEALLEKKIRSGP